jgi:hypothetical protein
MDEKDQRKPDLKARYNALKWLLVVCLAIWGIKTLPVDEDRSPRGCDGLGEATVASGKGIGRATGFPRAVFNVDGMYVQKQDAAAKKDYKPLVRGIQAKTGLSVGLDGNFRWIAFLPSRSNSRAALWWHPAGGFDGITASKPGPYSISKAFPRCKGGCPVSQISKTNECWTGCPLSVYQRLSRDTCLWAGLPFSYQSIDVEVYRKLLVRVVSNLVMLLSIEEVELAEKVGLDGQMSLFEWQKSSKNS